MKGKNARFTIWLSLFVLLFSVAAAGAAPLTVTPWVYGPVTIHDDGLTIASETADVNNLKFADGGSPTFMIQANPTGSEIQTVIRTFPITSNDSRIQIASHAPAGKANAIELLNQVESVTTNSLFFGDFITAFNNNGNDIDFKISSDSNTNMFVVDGGLDAVGIGGVPDNGDVFSVYGGSSTVVLSVDPVENQVTVTDIDILGNVTFGGRIISPKDGNRIISDDTITVGDSPYHKIDTEGGAATDNLCHIEGGIIGQELFITTVNAARDVTVLDSGTCNTDLPNAQVLDHPNDLLVLYLNSSGDWIQRDFSNNR